MIAIVILIVVGVIIVGSVIRLVWSVSRGDMQIEPSSYGRQLFRHRKRDEP